MDKNDTSIYYEDSNLRHFGENFSVTIGIGDQNQDVSGGCYDDDEKSDLFEFLVYGVLLNFISIFGILGNTISMIILSRPQMKSSINYLLIGLARCDTVLIVISVLIYGLPVIYKYTGYLFNYRFIIYPRIIRYLYPISCIAQIVTVYLTLTVTIERYIAVCHPLRARSFCTYGRARLAVFGIVIFGFIYNIPKFLEIDFNSEVHWKYNVTIYCISLAPLRKNNLYITVYVHWMYFFVYYSFPFIALVVFNVTIYKRVRKANRDLQQLSRHQRREIGLATMLLCVVIVFIICNILPLASNIFETFIEEPPLWLVQTGNLLVTINSSINFIIYVIFGRKFKRIFLRLFCSSRFLGRESPEFQAHDESSITNMTNIEIRNSIRHHHHHHPNRCSTIRRNNNSVHMSNDGTRHNMKMATGSNSNSSRPASPSPCVYYPARNSIQRTSSQNGWSRTDENGDTIV